MNRDQVRGAGKELGGKIKEDIGKAAGDRSMEAKGFVEKTAGKVERKLGEAEYAARREKLRRDEARKH